MSLNRDIVLYHGNNKSEFEHIYCDIIRTIYGTLTVTVNCNNVKT